MSFSVHACVKQPPQELLNLTMKSDLVLPAKDYEIAEVKTSVRKQAIIIKLTDCWYMKNLLMIVLWRH